MLADFIHARICKPICEKSLTLPTSDEVIKTILKKEGIVKALKGNGDFRSPECIEYLKECDICCTNPPFSLFAALLSLLIKYNKQYLLIGNQNAITYKEIFPYIKENKAWVGYRFGDMALEFRRILSHEIRAFGLMNLVRNGEALVMLCG